MRLCPVKYALIPCIAERSAMTADLTLGAHADVPRSSELETMVKVPAAARGRTWIVERNTEERVAGIVARAVVSPKDRNTPIRLCNPGDKRITIKKGTTIAMMEPLENDSQVVASLEEQKGVDVCSEKKRTMLWEIADSTRGHLTESKNKCFYGLLLEYSDICAKDRNDYGRNDIVKHRFKPVAPGTRIQQPDLQTLEGNPGNTSQADEHTLPYQVVEDNDHPDPPVPQSPVAHRYPVRDRRPPDYFV